MENKIKYILISVIILAVVCVSGCIGGSSETNSDNEPVTTDILTATNATLENNNDYRNFTNTEKNFTMDYNYKSYITFEKVENKSYDDILRTFDIAEISDASIAGFEGKLIDEDSILNVLVFLFKTDNGDVYTIIGAHSDLSTLSPGEKRIAKKVFEDVLTAWKNG